jgi:hypothetical protein
MSPLAELRSLLGPLAILPLPIPYDCTDGFMGAYWRRPSAYLDPAIRSAISAFALIPDVGAGIERLHTELENGTWDRLYGYLTTANELDIGYRLVIANAIAACSSDVSDVSPTVIEPIRPRQGQDRLT